MLKVFTGPMKSGKTNELLNEYFKLTEKGNKCILFKPSIDTRSGNTLVQSRSGLFSDSKNIQDIGDMLQYISDIDFIFIDEFQFLKGNLNIILELMNSGKSFIIAGLNLTSDKKPFGFMPEIMCYADEIKILKSECEVCKKSNASKYTFCKVAKNKNIKIGDEEYLGVCESCYNILKWRTCI